MKNYIQPGDTIAAIAPATVLSGAGVLIGSLFGVASGDAASGAEVLLNTTGVYDLPKNNGVDEGNLWGDYFYLEALARRAKPDWARYW